MSDSSQPRKSFAEKYRSYMTNNPESVKLNQQGNCEEERRSGAGKREIGADGD